jgi:putative membrane protein
MASAQQRTRRTAQACGCRDSPCHTIDHPGAHDLATMHALTVFLLAATLGGYLWGLLWAHMVQHELLMVVAAPLLVLGKPLEAWRWVMPLRTPKLPGDPAFAWGLHALGIWLWHAPPLFEAAVRNPGLHLAQHTSFFLPAAIFRWTVLAP